MAGSKVPRCYCNASSLPHRHTATGIEDAPDGKGEKVTPSGYEEVAAPVAAAAGVGVKKPIS